MENGSYRKNTCPWMEMSYQKSCDGKNKCKSMNYTAMNSCAVQKCPYFKMMSHYGGFYNGYSMMPNMVYPMYGGMMPNIMEGSRFGGISMIVPTIVERDDIED